MSAVGTDRPAAVSRLPQRALACGVLALLVGAATFWMIVPGVVLGLAAVVLGLRGRSQAGTDPRAREFAFAGMALGVAAIVVTPAMLLASQDGEEFGRACVVSPSNEGC